MIIISHRGNISGRIKSLENDPEQIVSTLEQGYHCEIDVNYIKEHNHLSLGHNGPAHVIDKSFLTKKNLWCHAKNVDALELMITMNIEHFFFHQRDAYTLTSSRYIWTFPGEQTTNTSRCIVVTPELLKVYLYKNAAGICTDFPEHYKTRERKIK